MLRWSLPNSTSSIVLFLTFRLVHNYVFVQLKKSSGVASTAADLGDGSVDAFSALPDCSPLQFNTQDAPVDLALEKGAPASTNTTADIMPVNAGPTSVTGLVRGG